MPFAIESENEILSGQANRPEAGILTHENDTAEEALWGNDEAEWSKWSTAVPYMTLKEYNLKQIQEMVGARTKKAFEKVMGTTTPPPNDDMLGMFYTTHGGAKYFKRRNYQYLKEKTTPEDIRNYYENRLWETKETNEHI
jgi:hypothetical protein